MARDAFGRAVDTILIGVVLADVTLWRPWVGLAGAVVVLIFCLVRR